MWVTETQVLGAYFALSEGWVRSETAGLEPAPVWDASVADSNLVCVTKSSPNFFC